MAPMKPAAISTAGLGRFLMVRLWFADGRYTGCAYNGSSSSFTATASPCIWSTDAPHLKDRPYSLYNMMVGILGTAWPSAPTIMR